MLSNLLEKIKKIFFELKSAFISTSKITFSFFKNKKNIMLSSILAFTFFGISGSSICLSSQLPLNRITTLNEIFQKYLDEEGSVPNVLLYAHQVVQTYESTVYKNNENLKEFREVFSENRALDIYVADWNGKYTPGIVDYTGKSDVHVSFVCMPKTSYVSREMKYYIPLLTSKNGEVISELSSPNDIYINKEYAQKLLIERGFAEENYSELLNSTCNIPYGWNSNKSEGRPLDLVDNCYQIKGVIDSTSEEYLDIKQKFGDFFIVNDYFTLPFPSQAYVEIKNRNDSQKIFKFLLNKYNYETVRNYFDTYNANFTYQYRITFFGSIESNLSINKIDVSNQKYVELTDLLFEKFCSSTYIINLSFAIIFNISFMLINFIMLYLLKKNSKANKIFMLILIIFLATFGVFAGILIIPFLFKKISIFSGLSPFNYVGTLLIMIEFILSILYVLLSKLKLDIQ